MKSLLVDVLREAQNNADGTKASADKSRTPVDKTGSPGEVTATQNELQILDVESGARLFATHSEPNDDDAMLLPVLDPTEFSDESDSDADPLSATGWLTAAGARLDNPAGWIAIVGRWSPVLCVASMLLAAGAYTVLQSLTAGRLNADLSHVSQQVSHSGSRQEFPIDEPGNGGAFRFNTGHSPEDFDAEEHGDVPRVQDAAQPTSLSPARETDVDVQQADQARGSG